MKKSEMLKNELVEVEKEFEVVEKQWYEIGKEDENKGREFYKNTYIPLRNKKEQLKRDILIAERFEVEVGDGVTVCLYSDNHAATVIKRTANSITIQYDKATLNPNFKPEFIVGGFAAHCTNKEEQTYTYERNSQGTIESFRWSNKYGQFRGGSDQSIRIINGRHEFYDYNF